MKIPSMLDLVHLSRRPLLPPGGIELCRQIALLTDMKEGDEVLVVPSGLAVTLEHFVREYEVQGSGVEDDLILLDDAEERLRGIGMLDRVHVQPGEMDGLPFRDGIFDVVIAELGLTARVSPESAVKELVRVAKAGASIVLVQPVWKAPVDPVRREILSQSLGCRPLMLVEWKRYLMDAGIVGLAYGGLVGRRNRFPASDHQTVSRLHGAIQCFREARNPPAGRGVAGARSASGPRGRGNERCTSF